jgi:ABC-type uncharacterized transport system fused permease/ATPase subunit
MIIALLYLARSKHLRFAKIKSCLSTPAAKYLRRNAIFISQLTFAHGFDNRPFKIYFFLWHFLISVYFQKEVGWMVKKLDDFFLPSFLFFSLLFFSLLFFSLLFFVLIRYFSMH